MKNKRARDEFRYLRNRFFLRTAGMLLIAGAAVIGLYNFVLKGHFANAVVAVLNFILRDYGEAYVVYVRIFRENRDFVFLIAVLTVFFLLMALCMRTLAKYFRDINRGIDTLLDEREDGVNLSLELSSVEKKINSVKSTLIRQRNEIQAAEQRKNDLIMYLAHDLKTPLASVIGYLNLLRDMFNVSDTKQVPDAGQVPDELREKYLSIALEKAERLEDLINEFFEITRLNLSNIVLQYGRIDLVRLLEQLIYEFTPMLREKNLTCKLHGPEELTFRCDADKMQRVFDNLLRNAVLYGYEGTQIEITVALQDDSSVAIQFVNCGDTIPREKLDRIFEQFYRLDSSRNTKSGGAGLGLAIAKQIVEMHGGTITAHSEQERIKFTVVLPQVR